MDGKCQFQLNTSSIAKVPYQFFNDFTFVVNNVKYKTSRLVADLLSAKIRRFHFDDPTIDEYLINTVSKGDFSHILNLVNFKPNYLQETEFPFIQEIISILEIDSLSVLNTNSIDEITTDNAFQLLLKHEKCDQLYSENIIKDIDFISSHFYEFNESCIEEIRKLQLPTIEKIISNKKIQLKDEDQLLSIINRLYSKDIKYSILYEYIYFANVGSEMISEFIQIFDHNDLTGGIWKSLANRLKQATENIQTIPRNRYKEEKMIDLNGISFPFDENKKFDGILRHMKNEGSINRKVSVTSSSNISIDVPTNVYEYDNDDSLFYSKENGKEDQWLCFDFKEHKIIPTNYTMRSTASFDKPKSWVLEGSNDNSKWDVIDERKDDSSLKQNMTIKTFTVSSNAKNAYRYVRIRQTGLNWYNRYYLTFGKFEFYGVFI